MVRISGKRVLPQVPAELWRRLTDAASLRQCLPGCEKLEEVACGRFRVHLRVRFGWVKGHFKGGVELLDLHEPETCRLQVVAQGTTGRLDGSARIQLSTLGVSGTELVYDSETRVAGLLSSVGEGRLGKAARDYLERFFDSLSRL